MAVIGDALVVVRGSTHVDVVVVIVRLYQVIARSRQPIQVKPCAWNKII